MIELLTTQNAGQPSGGVGSKLDISGRISVAKGPMPPGVAARWGSHGGAESQDLTMKDLGKSYTFVLS